MNKDAFVKMLADLLRRLGLLAAEPRLVPIRAEDARKPARPAKSEFRR